MARALRPINGSDRHFQVLIDGQVVGRVNYSNFLDRWEASVPSKQKWLTHSREQAALGVVFMHTTGRVPEGNSDLETVR